MLQQQEVLRQAPARLLHSTASLHHRSLTMLAPRKEVETLQNMIQVFVFVKQGRVSMCLRRHGMIRTSQRRLVHLLQQSENKTGSPQALSMLLRKMTTTITHLWQLSNRTPVKHRCAKLAAAMAVVDTALMC